MSPTGKTVTPWRKGERHSASIRASNRFPLALRQALERLDLSDDQKSSASTRTGGADVGTERAAPGRFAMIEEWESEVVLATRLAQESLQQSVAALLPMAFQPIAMQRLARRG